jgi:hypothetical protein
MISKIARLCIIIYVVYSSICKTRMNWKGNGIILAIPFFLLSS